MAEQNVPELKKDEQAPSAPPEKIYDLAKTGDLYSLIKEEDEEKIKTQIGKHLQLLLKKHGLDGYTTVILFDDKDQISNYHANRIYEAASSAAGSSDIFLILQSPGGIVEPAYLISKTCKRLSKKKFVVAVPRRAKSAATLIALGADEIHMGLMSQLGPIDPQIGGYPALGLANALNKLAELACKFPQASDMFAAYLTKNLDLKDLGYFERVSESAAQYAERLLSGKKLPSPHTPQSLANHFVNHYKDHSFVIDTDEAISLLGKQMVKTDSAEYKAANEIYAFLDFMGVLLSIVRENEYDYVGNIETGLNVRKQRK